MGRCPEMPPSNTPPQHPSLHQWPNRLSAGSRSASSTLVALASLGLGFPVHETEFLLCLIAWGSEKQRSWYCVLRRVQW